MCISDDVAESRNTQFCFYSDKPFVCITEISFSFSISKCRRNYTLSNAQNYTGSSLLNLIRKCEIIFHPPGCNRNNNMNLCVDMAKTLFFFV